VTKVDLDGDSIPTRAAFDEFFGLVDRANGGDERAAKALRPKLDVVPKVAEQLGDFAGIVRKAIVTAITGDQLAMREAITWKLGALRTELAQPSDGPLERLLVERVTLTWLQVHQAEGLYAQKFGELGIEWSDAYQRRIDRAQRRYLQAIRTLAQLRRMAVPLPIQVNVAERQVQTRPQPWLQIDAGSVASARGSVRSVTASA